MKGYKLYDLHLHTVFVSRDVVFHENIFPFALKHPISPTNPVLPLPIPIHDSTIPLLDPLLTNSFPLSSINDSPSSSSNMNPTTEPCIPSASEITPQPSRKSSRVKHTPGYLHDYHCHIATSTLNPAPLSTASGIPYSLSSVLSYDHLSSTQKLFSLSISALVEPTSYIQAVKMRNGVRLWIMRSKHLNKMIRGLLLIFLLQSMLLGANGFTKSSLNLMGLWRGIKLG